MGWVICNSIKGRVPSGLQDGLHTCMAESQHISCSFYVACRGVAWGVALGRLYVFGRVPPGMDRFGGKFTSYRTRGVVPGCLFPRFHLALPIFLHDARYKMG